MWVALHLIIFLPFQCLEKIRVFVELFRVVTDYYLGLLDNTRALQYLFGIEKNFCYPILLRNTSNALWIICCVHSTVLGLWWWQGVQARIGLKKMAFKCSLLHSVHIPWSSGVLEEWFNCLKSLCWCLLSWSWLWLELCTRSLGPLDNFFSTVIFKSARRSKCLWIFWFSTVGFQAHLGQEDSILYSILWFGKLGVFGTSPGKAFKGTHRIDFIVTRPHFCHFFSTQIFSTQIFLDINLEQERHKFW